MTILPGKGALIAAAVAGLFGCASNGASSGKSTTATTAGGPIQCAGINSCKGQGSCAGNENACKAQNSCKGKGWVEVASADECKTKGGTVVEKKM